MIDKSNREIATTAKADEIVQDYGDLIEVVPYAAEVVAAYRFVRQRRVRSFLRSLADATSDLDSAGRERFRTYIESVPGRELLAEFAETSLRSKTQTATAALAILYADVDCTRFPREFIADAVPALESLTDRTIDAFLLLSKHAAALAQTPDRGPYTVVAITGSVVGAEPELSGWSTEAAEWCRVVGDLTQRGILTADWAAGSRLADDDWRAYFALSLFSGNMSKLLNEARGSIAA
ncbi:MAG: hypothetical protein AMXMBFR57_09850 [Acidimicrobiia bacterium]